MDKTSLTLGWLVGRRIAGQRRTVGKQPVAYLYGEQQVRLPPLPVWDDKTYPYAVIVKHRDEVVGTQYWLAFYATQTDYEADRTSTQFWVQPCVAYLTKGTYQEWESTTRDYVYAYGEDALIWANHDILYKDSTEVCLPKSDPIPVYA